MINIIFGAISIIGTVLLYGLSLKLHKKYNYSFTSPVIIATICILIILVSFHIPYDTYMIGGEWINKLLGPAVVALAYPLYQQREVLKKFAFPVLSGIFIGAIMGISSGILLTKWAGFEELIILSVTPKSVTTPVAMAVADSIGGAEPLAVVFVMIAGIGGVTISTLVFKLFRIEHNIGQGVGLGSASHAIGTSMAMENSQLEGSVSTIAMVMCAVIVSVVTPLLIVVLL